MRPTTLILATLVVAASLDMGMSHIEMKMAENRWEGHVIPTDPPAPLMLDMPVQHLVTVTVYHAVPEQTDSTPFITASGARIDPDAPGDHRWAALSRDQLVEYGGGPYRFGDIIHLKGAGIWDGPWIVHDTMNKRFTNRMDLLVDESVRFGKYEGAIIALSAR